MSHTIQKSQYATIPKRKCCLSVILSSIESFISVEIYSANLRFAAAKINKKKETPNGLKNGKKKKGR
jgi:hypothetical protein